MNNELKHTFAKALKSINDSKNPNLIVEALVEVANKGFYTEVIDLIHANLPHITNSEIDLSPLLSIKGKSGETVITKWSSESIISSQLDTFLIADNLLSSSEYHFNPLSKLGTQYSFETLVTAFIAKGPSSIENVISSDLFKYLIQYSRATLGSSIEKDIYSLTSHINFHLNDLPDTYLDQVTFENYSLNEFGEIKILLYRILSEQDSNFTLVLLSLLQSKGEESILSELDFTDNEDSAILAIILGVIGLNPIKALRLNVPLHVNRKILSFLA
ncbi:hypothetical protein L1267_10800 [Pseudoalteromonas sp. OFAV1]|jgi:hypothetical protein|uniref:hypothetical protein n=1 Tax=Pseudoalteromonas sp. OFAV1 TaxID=2908892 RepID=UPI001F3473B7|nr:hypothetical protein [Pseudoalteromonas sp. OFAV1]MCF2900891.1 hypothetical protein [Pseudoalteromonas sp. OFAV1]